MIAVRASGWQRLAGGLVGLIAAAATAGQKPADLPADRADGAAVIEEHDLRAWLTELTSTSFAGRDTGNAGFRRAAELVRDHFAALQLEPAGDDGTYWQHVPWTREAPDTTTSFLRVATADREICRLLPGEGLHGKAARGTSTGAAPLVVVATNQSGAVTRSAKIAGAIVLVWAPEETAAAYSAGWRPTSLRKAAAVLLVNDAACVQEPRLNGRTMPGPGAANRAIRGRVALENDRIWVPSADVLTMLTAAGHARDDLKPGKALLLDGLQAELQLAIVATEAPAYNVVAVLPGRDPDLADEHVVVGCHLDHLGMRHGALHPGADDDGSGVVGLLAVASALAANPKRPRRSVMFVAFCGEELGMVGSKYFVEHPPIPLSAMVVELQMDMIGRHEESKKERARSNPNTLHLIGTEKLSTELHRLCLERNERHARFRLEWDEESIFYRSDHFSFAQHGVPVAFFFTGFHLDYHLPTDTVDKIDFEQIVRVATYVYDLAFELADREARPRVDEKLWRKFRRAQRNQAPEMPAAPLTGKRR